jgi:hypothetical protein
MLYATSAKEKIVITPKGEDSVTYEFGNYNKGTVNFFQNDNKLPHADNRLELGIINEGENYKVFLPIGIDNWINAMGGNMTVGDVLVNGRSMTDWYIRGNAGIFDGQVGSESYIGYTDRRSTWGSPAGWNELCRFGVWRGYSSFGSNTGFIAGNEFRTQPQWGTIMALGVTPVDGYRFALGYRMNPFYAMWNPGGEGYDSMSSINGTFLFSGRPVDGVSFDLFYNVVGADADTIERPSTKGTAGYFRPTAHWSNTIGAYVGLDIIDNLGISIGYTVAFNAYEAGGWLANDDTVSRAVTYNAPIYSGIDLHIQYTGIDNVPIHFNNNVSFAGAKGTRNWREEDTLEGVYNPTLVMGLNENYATPLREGYSEDWFHWDTELNVGLGFIDGVALTVALADKLAATTNTYVNPKDENFQKSVGALVDNELRFGLFAEHGVGGVSVGAGLFFGWQSTLITYVGTYKDGTDLLNGNRDIVTFGIPLMFKVQF